MQNWNPNHPHSVGLELFNQGGSTRRIAGLNEMGIVFRSLATENLARALIPVGGGTTSVDMVVPELGLFYDALPDVATHAQNALPGAICAELFPLTELQNETPPVLFEDFAVTAITGPFNSGTDHRYAQNDNLTGGNTVGTGTISAVGAPLDGQWLSDPAGNSHRGASAFSFNTGAFPLARQVLDIQFIVRASGPLAVTTVRNSDDTPGFWRSTANRVFLESKEFTDHTISLGEAFVDNPAGSNELRFATPNLVRAFASGGPRRLYIYTNAVGVSAPFIYTRLDYIVMRVFYYSTERRLARGTVDQNGQVYFHIPTDERTGATGASPYAKALNEQLYLSLRQLRLGNVPAPALAFSVPRINGTAPFSADWSVRDVVKPQEQVYRPGTQTVSERSLLFPEPEKAIPAAVLYQDSAALFVTAEAQPYAATGGFFPYILSNGGVEYLTQAYPNGGTATTNLQLMYVMVSDSLSPTNPITFKLRSTPDSDVGAVSVTMTPEEIAEFPVVGDATLWGSGTYDGVWPDLWEEPPTVVRWRKVRVKFPNPITFSASGGQITIRAVPNKIPDPGTSEGYTQNYLIGALLPIAAGGHNGGNTLNYGSDGALNVLKTNGDVAYDPDSVSHADLQLTFSKMPAAPNSISTQLIVDDPSLPKSHVRLGWTWNAGGGLGFKRFEIERYDAVTGEYQRVKNLEALGPFDDYEARFNVASTYRIRAVRADGVESDWVVSNPVTPVLGTCLLAFSSNTDPLIDSTYVDAYSTDTTQTFGYRDAGSVSHRRVYGRDYEVAFRANATGGVEFTRNVLLPTEAGARPKQNVDQSLLEMTRNKDIPYVCVRDENGNRWFASVTQTTLTTVRAYGSNNPIAVAALSIVETAESPIVDD